MRRGVIAGIGLISVVVIIVAYLIFAVPPPTFPDTTVLKRSPIESSWSTEIDGTHITGAAIWAKFAYYPDESIRLYRSDYWGALLFAREGLEWVDDQGNLQERALTLVNLTDRWQYNGEEVSTTELNGSSTFRFAYANHHLRVTFTVSRTADGDFKYDSLDEAWESGELYLSVTEW
jgi:hypothetical protein